MLQDLATRAIQCLGHSGQVSTRSTIGVEHRMAIVVGTKIMVSGRPSQINYLNSIMGGNTVPHLQLSNSTWHSSHLPSDLLLMAIATSHTFLLPKTHIPHHNINSKLSLRATSLSPSKPSSLLQQRHHLIHSSALSHPTSHLSLATVPKTRSAAQPNTPSISICQE